MSLAADVYTQMLPPVPTPASTALGTTSPGPKLTLLAAGRSAPHGYTVKKPGPPGKIEVTLSSTATAVAGMPARPATGTSSVESAGSRPVPWLCPSTVVIPTPVRDSCTRAGDTGVRPPGG